MLLNTLSKGGSYSSLLESINSGDFGACFGCEVFLTFFLAFVAVFFATPGLDAFLDFFSSSSRPVSTNPDIGSSDLDVFSAFLGC